MQILFHHADYFNERAKRKVGKTGIPFFRFHKDIDIGYVWRMMKIERHENSLYLFISADALQRTDFTDLIRQMNLNFTTFDKCISARTHMVDYDIPLVEELLELIKYFDVQFDMNNTMIYPVERERTANGYIGPHSHQNYSSCRFETRLAFKIIHVMDAYDAPAIEDFKL